MEQRLTPARIESRLANLPIYVYDLRDSLTYKPLKSEPWQYRSYSTVHSHAHISKAALACSAYLYRCYNPKSVGAIVDVAVAVR